MYIKFGSDVDFFPRNIDADYKKGLDNLARLSYEPNLIHYTLLHTLAPASHISSIPFLGF